MNENIKIQVLELVELHRSVVEGGGGALCRRFNIQASNLLVELENEGLDALSDRMMDVLSHCAGATRDDDEGVCKHSGMVQGILDGMESRI
ncbi:MAG: hypothetical protein SCAL_000251 [Candidatus Syntrophoarchaeum caldarius]|uniref:Uncharacterized protein n=1 Tax=Candidatus Syntropharchaeum caldarium TaxID=1838285 RepID=A0A1F2PC13_9EURY|nr:MAG: hypothetical protein SCAL_000251 [Candidatus Syntrophoarchaeum caldarius]